MTDASGGVTNRYGYTAFGLAVSSLTSETLSQAYRFTGERYDTPTGFYYLRARMYDPMTGRFTAFDPAEDFSNRLHKYVYCANDSVNSTDPSGEFFTLVSVVITAAIVALLAAIAIMSLDRRVQVEVIYYEPVGTDGPKRRPDETWGRLGDEWGAEIELGARFKNRIPRFQDYRWVQFITHSYDCHRGPAGVRRPDGRDLPFFWLPAERRSEMDQYGYDYIFYDIPAVWKENQNRRPDVDFWYKYNQPAYCRFETYLVGVAAPGSKNYTKIVEITWGFEIEHEEDIPRLDPVRIRYLQ